MTEEINFEKISLDLVNQGYSIYKNFLPTAEAQQILAHSLLIYKQDNFQPAGIGKGDEWQRNQSIRGDEIYWIENPEKTAHVANFYAKIRALALFFNRDLFIGINYIEMHFAIYPAGKFYKKHFDSFKGSDKRKVSFVLYLNPDWQSDDGGELRIYTRDKQQVDVLPEMGTLVCFLSNEILHEVRAPKNRKRVSLTGWMRKDELKDVLVDFSR